MEMSASKKRLPKLWSCSVPPLLKRYSKSSRNIAACFSSASARSPRRTSPGGSMPNSSRRTPAEPPESNEVKTAVISSGNSLSPRKSVYPPLPPPIRTTFFIMAYCIPLSLHAKLLECFEYGRKRQTGDVVVVPRRSFYQRGTLPLNDVRTGGFERFTSLYVPGNLLRR